MNILAIGAHHDDIELGCGGSVARLVEEGNKVFGITLTDSETHYKEKNIHRSTEQAITEARDAADVVGLTLVELDYPLAKNGMLIYNTELMRSLENFIVRNEIKMVFTHWQYDMNTDHAAASKISIVASRHVHNILQYRSNWYQPDRSFNGIYYIDISNHIDKKIESLNKYSGEIDNRSKEWINSFIDNNRSYGFSIGIKYAEVFEPIRISKTYK